MLLVRSHEELNFDKVECLGACGVVAFDFPVHKCAGLNDCIAKRDLESCLLREQSEKALGNRLLQDPRKRTLPLVPRLKETYLSSSIDLFRQSRQFKACFKMAVNFVHEERL